MKEYTYRFADGTKGTVEVSDEFYQTLSDMDKEEARAQYNYDRHNIPLSQFDYEGEAFIDPKPSPPEEMVLNMERKRLEEALSALSDNQRELFERVVLDGISVTEVAAKQGVCHQAVSARLARIKRKLQKFLE